MVLIFYEIERTAYNILDWFGDLGGLLEALTVFFGAVYGFVHYETFNNFLVQKLYRTEEGAQLQFDSSKDTEEKDSPLLVEGEWSCFIKRIVKFKCCISSCLRYKSKRYKLLGKGRKDLAVETDIVNLLKQLRAIWTILDMKLQLSKKEVQQVKEDQRRTLKIISDPDDSQADESNFVRKITLRRYDPARNLKRIQRPLVSSSFVDEETKVAIQPEEEND